MSGYCTIPILDSDAIRNYISGDLEKSIVVPGIFNQVRNAALSNKPLMQVVSTEFMVLNFSAIWYYEGKYTVSAVGLVNILVGLEIDQDDVVKAVLGANV